MKFQKFVLNVFMFSTLLPGQDVRPVNSVKLSLNKRLSLSKSNWLLDAILLAKGAHHLGALSESTQSGDEDAVNKKLHVPSPEPDVVSLLSEVSFENWHNFFKVQSNCYCNNELLSIYTFIGTVNIHQSKEFIREQRGEQGQDDGLDLEISLIARFMQYELSPSSTKKGVQYEMLLKLLNPGTKLSVGGGRYAQDIVGAESLNDVVQKLVRFGTMVVIEKTPQPQKKILEILKIIESKIKTDTKEAIEIAVTNQVDRVVAGLKLNYEYDAADILGKINSFVEGEGEGERIGEKDKK